MKKPIIGIVGREDLSREEGKSISLVGDKYRQAIIKSGGIPLLILPTQSLEYPHFNLDTDRELTVDEENDLIRILKMCDGIVMPGGCKIFYYDKFIANYAINNDIPILGICLGMQILGAIDCEGEKVIEKISNDDKIQHKIKDLFAHKVKIEKDSILYDIVQNEEFLVNSRHRCNVIKTNKFDIVRTIRRWSY